MIIVGIDSSAFVSNQCRNTVEGSTTKCSFSKKIQREQLRECDFVLKAPQAIAAFYRRNSKSFAREGNQGRIRMLSLCCSFQDCVQPIYT